MSLTGATRQMTEGAAIKINSCISSSSSEWLCGRQRACDPMSLETTSLLVCSKSCPSVKKSGLASQGKKKIQAWILAEMSHACFFASLLWNPVYSGHSSLAPSVEWLCYPIFSAIWHDSKRPCSLMYSHRAFCVRHWVHWCKLKGQSDLCVQAGVVTL